jgi:aspartyl-tRNA(Asn)/glutamyl-tRNA(Gln) amidotransferase subunit C
MSALSRDEVAHLTQLARIHVTDAELDHLSAQLGVILESVQRVREVAAAEVPPMSHPVPLTNVTRPDEPQQSLSPEQALAGAPAQQQQRFRVPRILEDD